MADVLSVIADVLKNDKQQKREQAKMMREVQKKLKEKDSEEVAEEPGDKEDYMKFFAGKLKKYGVKSPAELSDEDKKKFFNEIEKDWKHDSSEEVEVKEKDLGKRVKSRMEAEDEEDIGELPDQEEVPVDDDDEEDEDEDPVGEPEEDEVDMDEPSEDQIEKIADLVVQKLKDKADEEEEEEQEPDSTEAEGGKEEDIDTEPKVENLHRNPHRKSVWLDALRKVYTVEDTQDKTQQLDEHCGVCDEQGLEEVKIEEVVNLKKLKKEYDENEDRNNHTGNYLLLAKAFGSSSDVKKVEEIMKRNEKQGETSKKDMDWMHKNINPYYDKIRNEEVEVAEGNDKPIEDAAKRVQHNWKRMSTRDKVKFKDKMDDLASKNRVSDADLEEILDDYGLNEEKESIGMTFLRKHKTKDKQ